MDLISIEDNGIGIKTDQLPLAFCRHATSKISKFEDLYGLHTYGFRGEALASIASISKVTCSSNIKGAPLSTLKIEGGLETSFETDDKISQESGTAIYIKDLFFNTPVRMKFIQSKTSEKNHLKKMINSFILTHPEIEFDVKWDDESKVRYHQVPSEKLSTRIETLFGKKNNPLTFLDFEAAYDGFHTRIILSKNSQKGYSQKFHYIFVNNRIVTDIQIHKIILNSATNLWPQGETGNYCIYISVPTDQLDVNVHPNKTVVKIFQAPKLFSLISSSIKQNTHKAPEKKEYHEQAFLNEEIHNDQSMKEVNYRANDFTANYELESYFDRLDNKTNSSHSLVKEETQILFQTNGITLFQHLKKLYICQNETLFMSFAKISLNNKKNIKTPLLISEPIKSKQKLTEEQEEILSELGFELDRLDSNTLVLRTFPEKLNDFPYHQITKNVVFNLEKNQDLFSSNQFEFEKLTQHQLNLAIKEVGLSVLLSNTIIKEVSMQKLQGLL